MRTREFTYEEAVDLPLDPLSELTMTYTPEGFIELKKAIEKRGQQVPILLRNGCILDGRHRHRACQELGVGLKYEELGPISDDEALDLVIDSSVSKAIGTEASRVEAYFLCKAKGWKQREMVTKFDRLNRDYVKKMSYIEKENPEYLRSLLRQKKVRLYNKTFDKIEDYGTLHGIYKTLKGNAACKDKVIEVTPRISDTPEYEFCLEDHIPEAAARDLFWEHYYMFKIQHPASKEGLALIKLITAYHKTLDIPATSATLPASSPDLKD